jgi:hypothetical protein
MRPPGTAGTRIRYARESGFVLEFSVRQPECLDLTEKYYQLPTYRTTSYCLLGCSATVTMNWIPGTFGVLGHDISTAAEKGCKGSMNLVMFHCAR